MKTIRVYCHPGCARCARHSRWHRRLDWLDRVETSTATPHGHDPLRVGEVVVEDLRDFTLHEGVDAFALLAREVPLYRPLLALLRFPALRAAVERDMRGARDAAGGRSA